MSDFTRIVRPNQTPEIRPQPGTALRRPPDPPAAPDSNLIVWGSGGDNAFQLRANVKQSIAPINNEESRRFDVVRVENPDDSEQYVETEVMTEYQGRNSLDKSRFTLRFGAPTPSTNVKIVSRGNVRKTNT